MQLLAPGVSIEHATTPDGTQHAIRVSITELTADEMQWVYNFFVKFAEDYCGAVGKQALQRVYPEGATN